MEAEIVAFDHCCRKYFLIMDTRNLLGAAVELFIIYDTTNVSIHEDNYRSLIMAETLSTQFSPWSKQY